jgi:AAA family ATP:ADP antiporter
LDEVRAQRRLTIIRVVGICFLSIWVNASYALARPSIESLFTEAYTAKMYPRAWLVVAVGVTITVLLYNKLVASRPLSITAATTAAVATLVLALVLGAREYEIPGATFALYIWKEIYIVVLLEGLWTLANSVFKTSAARWVYGLFCVVGSIAATLGGLALTPISEQYGTGAVPYIVIPFLLLYGVTPLVMARFGADAARPTQMKTDFAAGFRVVFQSRYLYLMLILILVVQVVITLIDYEYQVMLEQLHPTDKDARTAIGGQVYAAIDVIALVLQALTGVILSFLGVGKTLLSVPTLLGVALAVFLIYPKFVAMAVTKVASKALDYSLSRASKELLYVPLTPSEKRQGKAVIDMLCYRFAKALVSGLLLILEAAGFALTAVTVAALSLIGAWLYLIRKIVTKYAEVRLEQAGRDPDVVDETNPAALEE